MHVCRPVFSRRDFARFFERAATKCGYEKAADGYRCSDSAVGPSRACFEFACIPLTPYTGGQFEQALESMFEQMKHDGVPHPVVIDYQYLASWPDGKAQPCGRADCMVRWRCADRRHTHYPYIKAQIKIVAAWDQDPGVVALYRPVSPACPAE